MSDTGAQEHQDFKFIPPKDGHTHVIPTAETIVPERSGVSSLPEDRRNIVEPQPPVPDMKPQTPHESFWERVRKGKFH